MTLPSFLHQAWRSLLRDARAGDLNLLIVAVTLAVAALTSVGFFADRLKGGLQRDARQMLGGDAVLASDQMPPQVFIDKAVALGLQTTQHLSFPTMARAPDAKGGASKLVALKAVSAGYPLRGKLRVAPHLGAPDQPAVDIPQPGEAWVDAALLDALGLQMGDTLLLGDTNLKLSRIVVVEPDRGAGFMNFAPRVLVNRHDIAASGLVQPASRVNYRLAIAAADIAASTGADSLMAVSSWLKWAEAELKKANADGFALYRGVRIESLETGRPEMRQTLDRAEKFLNLVALLSALLSAVAVALGARSFAAKHLDACAMLRVLGLSQRNIALSYTAEFAAVGALATAMGVLIGYAVHHLFVLLLAGLVDASLPAPSAWPVFFGCGVGLTLLFAFGLPPVLQLARVPPLRVIRRDVGSPSAASAAVVMVGVAGFAALLLAVSADATLGMIAVGGFAGAVLLFAGFGWLSIRLLRRWVNEELAPRWLVLATRQLSARPAYAVVQISSLSVGLLALVLLVLLRTDLVSSWQKATPPDAPNRFVINIMPEQGDAFRQMLQDKGVRRYDWYPMIRGRLVAINDKAVNPEDYTDERAKRLLDREFNVSHSAELPPHNLLTDGTWTREEPDAISIETGIAKTLQLKVGDRLRFDMGGVTSQARITSLRKVDWGSLRANFYVMYPVSNFPDVPMTYLAALRSPAEAGFDHQLVRQFPNVTNVDMGATIDQVQRVLGQVIRAVEFLFAFALAAGLVVLVAAVSATREERAREFAIMRALGASSQLLRQVQRVELVGVGALAGVLASAVGVALGWALARYVFEFTWAPTLWVPLGTAIVGASLALLAGWWSLREVLRRPVVQTLRA